MSRQVGMACAGVLMLVAAGCSLDSFKLLATDPPPQQQVVAGSVPVVSLRLQDAMVDAGIVALERRQGQGATLFGTTNSRKVFTLLLTPQPTRKGKKTLVTVKWDKERDADFWRTIVLPLASVTSTEESDDEDAQLPPVK
jgi:hypothetical protein